MFKTLICTLLVCALCSIASLSAFAAVLEDHALLSPDSLSAQSAILTDGEGNVLFEKNGRERMGPASTTKLLTALVAAEACAPDARVKIPREAVGVEGSSVYLCEGEVLTVEQLLYAVLLASANDAATALALFCSGSIEAFCDAMNEKARTLGLTDTHFVNPHGLYHDDHYTTAHDLAVMASALLQHSLLRKIVSTYKTTIPLNGDEGTRVLVNHNKMLRLYDGAIGVKTGFTKKTGRTLVSAAERDGLLLIAVTLDAPNDWSDHEKLLDYGFANFERVTLFEAGVAVGSIPVCGGRESTVALCPKETVCAVLPKGTSAHTYAIEASGHFLYAPIASGQTVGRAVCRMGDQTWEIPLVAANEVPHNSPKKSTPWERLLHFFKTDHS